MKNTAQIDPAQVQGLCLMHIYDIRIAGRTLNPSVLFRQNNTGDEIASFLVHCVDNDSAQYDVEYNETDGWGFNLD